ncbi:MAG: trigger factor [Caulobacteraceae bacterium]
MQIVEKRAEGLIRLYGISVPAAELSARLEARIAEIAPTLKLKGFRPGKASPAHVKRMYGRSLMGEVVEQTINETSQQVLNDQKLRIAAQPDLRPSSDMEAVLAGREDLAYDLDVELMPEFDPADVTGLELTRLVYAATEPEIDVQLAEVVAQNRTYVVREGDKAQAQDGDQVLMDFAGRIDGQPFEGGEASDVEIVLGAGRFLAGFEAALIGAAEGETVLVETAFPDDYPAEHLAGKAAEFTVAVKSVRSPVEATADDSLAQRLGLADMAALREALRANLEREYREASRFKLKRALLDELDQRHVIDLPSRMVEAEFHTIWHELEKEREAGALSPEDAGKSEEDLRAEYRRIAERRVRLGLVLAEIGRREQVTVNDQEVTEAIRGQAMQYGARAQEMFDLMRQNTQIQANLRAPIYEEKVVDLILGRAKVNDKSVSKEELLRDDDAPAPVSKPADEAKAKPARRAKKAEAKASAEPEATVEDAASAKSTRAKPAKAAPKTPADKSDEPPAAPKRKAKAD